MAQLSAEERVACRSPNAPGGKGVRIPKWKYELVRSAILAELGEHEVPFAELTKRVGARMSAAEAERLGSLGWHVTTVELELEVLGEIRRLSGSGRQMLELSG